MLVPMGLHGFERRWLDAVFDTILPSGSESPLPGAREVPLDRFITDLTHHAPARMRVGLRLALWFVTFAPIVLVPGWRIFPSLAPDVRLAVLRRLQKNPRYLIRESVLLLKAILLVGYCGLPSVQAEIGLPQ